MSGFVSFVSAGPGDPELLTLKGAARLREAEVVLYDDLASGAILDLARAGANVAARTCPMPTVCEPCPGNTNARFMRNRAPPWPVCPHWSMRAAW